MVAPLRGHGQADQSAAVPGHEIDRLGCYHLGGHGQVAFIFPVFIIDQDHHLPLPDLLNGFFYPCYASLFFSS